ncbi:hypothetical protein MLD38_038103 [Melastoma candidum]|uniref:Uncharacterized protein n=1 Tax=Melastoma candidum TaxID=119954 RepID=A0ACB9KZ13_9MYRT|nr:hypothetical protein MLD38_038103 [Melastoma candidum]
MSRERPRKATPPPAKEITCGSELAVLLVEALSNGRYACNEEALDDFVEDRITKIYKRLPHFLVPQQLEDDDDDMKKLYEAIGATKTRAKCCSSFSRSALK